MNLPVGINSNNSETRPPDPVRKQRSSLKFPILSARKPAKGGVKMKRTGITALTIAVSSIVIPDDQYFQFKTINYILTCTPTK